MAKSMKPGGGGRFAKMKGALEKEGHSEESAGAIAASAGRKKYGKKKFQKMAEKGEKRAAKNKHHDVDDEPYGKKGDSRHADTKEFYSKRGLKC